jgi:hypothetical protein
MELASIGSRNGHGCAAYGYLSHSFVAGQILGTTESIREATKTTHASTRDAGDKYSRFPKGSHANLTLPHPCVLPGQRHKRLTFSE